MRDTNDRAGRRMGLAVVVALLGVTQIIGYGTLYYAFGILAPDLAATLGWSVSGIFAAFSASLLLSGALAPWVGRQVDRHGAPAVLAAGSLTAALALLALSQARGPWSFAGALALVEVASTLALYDTAFACIVQRGGPAAGRGITSLTLIAGFASTLFWPLTTALHAEIGWRSLLMGFAVLNLVVACPLHGLIWASTTPPPQAPAAAAAGVSASAPLPAALQRKAVLLVAAGFALGGFVMSATLSQMVLLLQALGLGANAVLVSTLFGPSQVLVRFASMVLGRTAHPLPSALLSGALMPLAVLLLLLPIPTIGSAALFAVVLGCGSGLKSIVQGTLPLALFGRVAYAERLGTLRPGRTGARRAGLHPRTGRPQPGDRAARRGRNRWRRLPRPCRGPRQNLAPVARVCSAHRERPTPGLEGGFLAEQKDLPLFRGSERRNQCAGQRERRRRALAGPGMAVEVGLVQSQRAMAATIGIAPGEVDEAWMGGLGLSEEALEKNSFGVPVHAEAPPRLEVIGDFSRQRGAVCWRSREFSAKIAGLAHRFLPWAPR